MRIFNIEIMKINELKAFLGSRVWYFLKASVILGIVVFSIEASFVYVIQLFLYSIGLIDLTQLNLPDWVDLNQIQSIFVFLVFGVMRSFALGLKFYISGIVGQEFIKEHRSRALLFGLKETNSTTISEIVTLFTERTAQAGALLQAVSQLIMALVTCLFLFLLGIRAAPTQMIVSTFILLFLLIPILKLRKQIESSGNGVRGEWNIVSNILISGIKNHFFLSIYGLIEQELAKGIRAIDVYSKHFEKYIRMSALKNYLPGLLGIIVICGTTVISVHSNFSGIHLVTFFYIFLRLSQGASDINSAVSEIILHKGSALELFELFKRSRTIQGPKPKIKRDEIDFNSNFGLNLSVINLGFSYGNEKNFLFQNLEFEIELGQVLLIKGPSGVGKSTLLKLLIGFVEPTEGSVLYNGVNAIDLETQLSNKIGYVGPEPYLIPGTIKENLLFGNVGETIVDSNDMINALNCVMLGSEFHDLSKKVSEQSELSTGQKQRLSIARALLREPSILVLDEATANLDSRTEELVIKNLFEVKSSKIIIVVSHKDSFDKYATKVIDLGKIYA